MSGPHIRRTAGRGCVLAAVLLATALSAPALPALATPTGPAAPTPEERAAALARPAVVYLETQWSGYVFDEDGLLFNGGQPYQFASRCTGFVVDPAGYMATAGHCVDPAIDYGSGETFIGAAVAEAIALETYTTNDPGELFAFGAANWRIEGAAAGAPADSQVFVQRGTATGGRTDGEAMPARVVDFRPLEQGDVALLKVEQTDLPAIEVGAGNDVGIGTSVLSIGYPGSTDEVTDTTFEPTNKDGKVNAEKTVGTVSFLEMSAALSGGMSGGPTVDLEGDVVGVNSWSPTSEAQAFNFMAPSSHLTELMSRNGVTNELGSMDVAYRAGLEAHWAGQYTAAIAEFDRVISIIPSHQQAQEYRQAAAADREAFGDSAPAAEATGGGNDGGGLPVLLVVVAVLGVVGLGGLGAFLGLRGRGGETPSPASGSGSAPSGWPQQPAPTPVPMPQAAPQSPPTRPQGDPLAPPPQPPILEIPDQASAPAPETRVLESAMVAAKPARSRRAAPAAVNGRATQTHFCAQCGAKHAASAKFCPSCGGPVS